MKFKRVKWKNFLSYPNSWTEYEFKNGLTLIQGPIGAGKSTIIDVLNFALFGTPYRKITIPRLVNSKNKKNLLVELEIEKNGKEILIKRGISPNVFEIYVNGNLIPLESKKKKYQEVLEEVLGINEKLFNQVLVKSLAKGSSFFTLPKGEKRKIIESLFNIEIFGLANEVLKERKKELEKELNDLKQELFLVTSLLKSEREKISKIEEIYNQEIFEVYNRKIDEIESEIEKEKQKYEEFYEKKKKYLKFKEKFDKVKNKLSKIEREIGKYKGSVETIGVIKEIMEEICNECEKKCVVISKLYDKWNLNEFDKMKNNKEKFEEWLKEKEGIVDKISRIDVELKAIKKNIQKLEREKDKILRERDKKLKMKNEEINDEKIKEYEERIKNISKKIKELKWKLDNYEIMIFMCSEDGIKKQIINQYLPLLNAILTKYFEEFEVNFSIQLDSDFNEIVNTRFRENFVYFNFSEGEKRIIDLSMLFAFIEFVEKKSNLSDLNLLILDEITTGLDRETDEILYKVLRNIAKKKEVIIMSHTNWDITRYDRIFDVKVEKGFSRLKEV